MGGMDVETGNGVNLGDNEPLERELLNEDERRESSVKKRPSSGASFT